MIPKNSGLYIFSISRQPTKTYRMNIEKMTISGFAYGKEAMAQAIYKILSTIRFNEVIYSWNYGAEISGLPGRSREYIYSVIRERITEALLQDDRITDVNSFEFESGRDYVHVTFTAVTTEGTVPYETEVTI